MQDSTITYKVTTVGIAEAEAQFNALGATIKNVTINQNGSVTASGNLSKAQAEQAVATGNASKATDRASKSQGNYIAHIAKTTILSAGVNKAFLGLVSSAGDAVKQVDLFSNFPASMAALGLSSKDASESLLTLRDYAAQSGVSLTEATQSVARFSEITKNVKAATAEFIGVKNALIAGGAGSEVQSNALEQLTQAYSRGKPQLIEWRSLMVAMPAQLNQVAKAMNLPNAQALGESLTKGKVSMQDFLTELTKLSTGTGPIATQALARMQGIEFAANVMKNTLTNGLAAIYQAVGKQNIIAFFSFLTQVIVVLTGWAVRLISTLITLFNFISGIFGGPQLAKFSNTAQDSANALGTGAANAGDMADGLGNAADNAQKINKSLASFDKMNVLPDKTSGKAADTGGGAGGLSPADASALNDIFGGIGKKLQEASQWAKIFAGILAGLLGLKVFKGILGELNDTIDTFKKATQHAKDFGSAVKTAGQTVGKGLKIGGQVAKDAGTAGKEAGLSFINGLIGFIGGASVTIAGAIGTLFSETIIPAVTLAGNAILDAFLVFAGGVAVVLGVPLEAAVAIIAAVVAVIVGIIYLIWTNWETIWNFMKGLFDTVVNAIVATWQTLYDIFAGPIKFLIQFWTAVFTLIVAIVAIALELIFKLVVGFIVLVYNVLSAIAGWINTNVIQPTWQFFQWLWDTVTNAVVTAWQWIFTNVLMPIANWINTNVIQPVVAGFKWLWDTVSGFVGGFVGGVKNFLSPLGSWIYNYVILPIAGFFKGLWDGIKTGVSGLISSIQSIIGGLGGILKAPINAIFTAWNKVADQINKVKVPSWVPGIGGNSVNFPKLTLLARGGVVSQPTLSMIGESGAEAVVPLENNTEWIDKLASKINTSNVSGQPVQITVQIGEDKIASKIIDLINERTQMGGRNAILV